MTNEPLVSILMNCYNGEKYLREAINSVIVQTYPNWEIIFWDNASTDKSKKIVLGFNDNRIKYFYSDENTILGKARNFALSKSRGEYICILDTDDYFYPNKLEKQLYHFRANPEDVLVYSDLDFIISEQGKSRKINNKKKMYKGEIFPYLIKRNFIYLSTIMLNKKCAERELYFNDKYRFVEEYDLFLRLSLIGKFGLIDEPLGVYRIHKNNFVRNSKNQDIIINEKLKILECYKNTITQYNLNIDKLIGKLFSSYVLRNIRFKKYKNIKAVKNKLLKYPSIKNLFIYLLLQLNIPIVYQFYVKLKSLLRKY